MRRSTCVTFALAAACSALGAWGVRERERVLATRAVDVREAQSAGGAHVLPARKVGVYATGLIAAKPAFAWLHHRTTPSRGRLKALGTWSSLQSIPAKWLDHIDGLALSTRGNFGEIYRGTLKSDPMVELVVKEVCPRSDRAVGCVQREVGILAELKLPGVIRLHASTSVDALQPNETAYILMEAAAGDLEGMVINRTMEEVGLHTRVRLFADVLRSVVGLAERNLVHRDIKPANILLVGEANQRYPGKLSAVLGDFGCCCGTPGHAWYTADYCGTALYVPPEAWRSGAQSCKYDVWSLGLTFFRLLTGQNPEPLHETTDTRTIRCYVRDNFTVADAPSYARLHAAMPEMAKLVARMTDRSATKRITAREALAELEGVADDMWIDIAPRRRGPTGGDLGRWAALSAPPTAPPTARLERVRPSLPARSAPPTLPSTGLWDVRALRDLPHNLDVSNLGASGQGRWRSVGPPMLHLEADRGPIGFSAAG